jgi:glycine/D-amino acid oxidase-like deaminating enzyme
MAERPVVVVGAGVIGLSTAYALARRGVAVQVIDQDGVGRGASFANGGWINRSDALPLPAPGVARYALSRVGQPGSPVYVQPRIDPSQLLWLLRFGWHCRRTRYERGAAALTALAERTRELYESWRDSGLDFEIHRTGHLHVFTHAGKLKSTLAAADLTRRLGYDPRPEVLTGRDARELEPCLSSAVEGGILFPHEAHVDPHDLATSLARGLTAMGVVVETGVALEGFETSGSRVTACVTAEGARPCSAVVLAAGVDTRHAAAALGDSIPVVSGKGYSFSLPLPVRPTRTMLLGESKVGLTPVGTRTRLLGTMEFSGDVPVLRRRRIDAMLQAAAPYIDDFPHASAETFDDAWVGRRPMTPDGLPVMDRSSNCENVFFNTGHGMLGIMLGAASGDAMAEYVASGRRPDVLSTFTHTRFVRTRPRPRSPVAAFVRVEAGRG